MFGSRSDFNWLCFDILKELQQTHSDIVCVAYNTKNEDFAYGGDTRFNEVYKPESLYVSGKASYVERNRIMIDNSDACVFYYNKDYRPKQRLISDKSIAGVWTSKQSDTALAYEYAVKKKKRIINAIAFDKVKSDLSNH